ncbi:MAG: response regulator [Candidatus Nitrospinota bacterium M3_3B_026]
MTLDSTKSVLVIDDNQISRRILEEELASAGMNVIMANSAEHGMDLAHSHIPDMITLDLAIDGVGGLELISRLKSSEKTSRIPLIVITGAGSQKGMEKALNAGAVAVFRKPFPCGKLGMFVNKRLASSAARTRRRRILLVEDSETIRAITKYLLERKGHDVLEASDGVEGWEALQKGAADIDMVVTDINMPNMDGRRLVEKIRKEDRFQFIPIIISTTISEKENIKLLLNMGADDYIVKPFSSEEFIARIQSHLRVKSLYEELGRVNQKLAQFNETLEKRVRERTTQLREANLDAIYSLALAAEAKDDATGNHVHRIQRYCQALALKLGISDTEAEEIGYSSIMHDVGKIAVPDEILKKPGKFTPGEFETMKAHTVNGEKILPSKPFFAMARRIARGHHEKWDGSGYPDGLAGEDIPLCARITAVADVFDALISKRSYKDEWPIDKAMAEMKRCSGSHFDPSVVDAMFELYDQGELDRILEKWI